jgi:5-dehydro-2-deoxygluconokinase
MMIEDAIAKKRFLVIGRVGMDLTPSPVNTRTEDATTMMVAMGGSSANIAAGLCRLGCGAALLTAVSDDSVGWYCLDQLDKYGIDRRHVKKITGEYRTSLAVYETRIDNTQSVIYRNNAADFQMTTADVEAVDFAAFGAVITTGTVFAAEPSRSAAFRAFDLARAAGVPIVFDVDYRPYSWPSADVAQQVLSRAGEMADIIIGNDEEFGFMAGDIAKGLDKARDLAGSGVAIVVYKRGPDGSVTFAAGQEVRTGIFPAKAVKPTGAGDSFLAGFMAALADRRPVAEAVLRGSACASIVVSRPGCAPAMPHLPELEAFLAAHLGPTSA